MLRFEVSGGWFVAECSFVTKSVAPATQPSNVSGSTDVSPTDSTRDARAKTAPTTDAKSKSAPTTAEPTTAAPTTAAPHRTLRNRGLLQRNDEPRPHFGLRRQAALATGTPRTCRHVPSGSTGGGGVLRLEPSPSHSADRPRPVPLPMSWPARRRSPVIVGRGVHDLCRARNQELGGSDRRPTTRGRRCRRMTSNSTPWWPPQRLRGTRRCSGSRRRSMSGCWEG